MKFLELVTTGRKSDQPGASRLLHAALDEPAPVGTNAGAECYPAWVKNLAGRCPGKGVGRGRVERWSGEVSRRTGYGEMWKLFVEAGET